MNVVLWIVQVLLALLFLFAGGIKLLPIQLPPGPVEFPGWFIRFIGLAEFLGGLGLILPWLLRIKPILTPLAAVGLLSIMVGATAISLKIAASAAVMPAVVGLLLLFVAYGRRNPAARARSDAGSDRSVPSPSV
jgi:hypothetical protein